MGLNVVPSTEPEIRDGTLRSEKLVREVSGDDDCLLLSERRNVDWSPWSIEGEARRRKNGRLNGAFFGRHVRHGLSRIADADPADTDVGGGRVELRDEWLTERSIHEESGREGLPSVSADLDDDATGEFTETVKLFSAAMFVTSTAGPEPFPAGI